MALARQRHDWSRTSSLMALIANTQRNPRKHRAFRPGDFDPFAVAGGAVPRVGVGVLKTVFIDQRVPTEVLEQ